MDKILDLIGGAINAHRTIVLAGASFFFFFILSYEDPSTTWNAWIYRWSSLLAALAAITAALITVRQMQQSDEKAEKRHEQLVRVQIRADTLRILRAAHPQAEDIGVQTDRVERAIERFVSQSYPQISTVDSLRDGNAVRYFSPLNLSNITETAEEIQKAAFALGLVLAREYLPAARDLFRPKMEMLYREAKELTSSIPRREMQIYDAMQQKFTPLQDAILWRVCSEVLHDGYRLNVIAKELNAEILRMTEEYA